MPDRLPGLPSPAARWLAARFSTSDSADVKQRYLLLHAEETAQCCTPEDPLWVHTLEVSPNRWSLEELLWRTRLIAMDGRTLWECLGPALIAERLWSPIDPWNEQLAVKVAFSFLDEVRDAARIEDHLNNHDDGGASHVPLGALREALERYATEAIKPPGFTTVGKSRPTDGMASPATEDSDKHRALSDVWSEAVAFLPMIEEDDCVEGSLICTAPVPSCGTLLQVPRTEMFFHDTILQHCALGRAIAAEPSLCELLHNEEALLVLCLVYEKFVEGVEHSHWRRLLRHCPARYPTMPISWDVVDLAELDGLDMLEDVLAKRGHLQSFAEQLENAFLPLLQQALLRVVDASHRRSLSDLSAALQVEHLLWAQCTFDSRAFNLNIDGTVVMALVPLADMVNHANRTDVLVRRVEPDGGPFVMQVGAALTRVDVGRELWMSYGPLQNWELLQHYGFTLGCDNVHDKLPFPLTLPAFADALCGGEVEESTGVLPSSAGDEADAASWDRRRQALLTRYALCLAGRCWIGYDGVPPAALLALLRVQLAESYEFSLMESRPYGPFEALSPSTEAAVVAAVRNAIQCVLDAFPTTLAADEASLAALQESESAVQNAADDNSDNDALSDNSVLCLQLRVGLKRVACRSLQWCSSQSCACVGHG